MRLATTTIHNTSARVQTGLSPRFSIITSTLNVASALPLTARSLAEQTCRDFEWIVIDSASKDGTADVARGFGDLVTILVSEPDSGIYDAWNKALPLVRGQWLLFLGAGDTLYSTDVLAKASSAIKLLPPYKTTLYGSVAEIDPTTHGSERVRDEVFQGLEGPWGGGRPLLPCHQGVFQRASVFEGFRFDQRCQISADNELLLQELLAGRGVKLHFIVTQYETGGISSQARTRLRMVTESIYINWKLGIFWKRPLYQLAVLGIKIVGHLFRNRWSDRHN